ncbi:gluconolactonase [Lewinellaceae bacterium SD302]|nr:gluconolactonase [Lewinellaceae bacterium SD302]
MKISTLASLLIILLSLCNCTPRFTSRDFTPEKGFTSGVEGPATDAAGNIYAVNFERQGTIGKITPGGKASVYLALPDESIGNGIRFDRAGRMFIADYVNHNVLMVEKPGDPVKVFAHEESANQPNDLTIAPNGTIYASDPNWAEETGNLWIVTAAGFELLESDMGTTNGVEVSPDGSRLYVNESVQRKIWMYDLSAEGEISNKRIFATFPDFGLDGMRCRKNGNLFVTRFGKGTIVVFTPSGKQLREIKLKGEKPTNLTFSPDEKWLYVTLQDRGCLERVRL